MFSRKIVNLDSNRNKARKRDWQPKKNLSQVYPESFEEYFEYVDCWGWSSVMASYLVGGCPLRWTMYGIWRKYEFFELFEINKQTFFNFTDRIERAYQKVSFYWISHEPIKLKRLFQTGIQHSNTYHNSTHAADVLQTVHIMINHTGLYHWLSDLELMAMLFAAAIHDAEHTGTTNAFHVSIQSNLAKLYKVPD